MRKSLLFALLFASTCLYAEAENRGEVSENELYTLTLPADGGVMIKGMDKEQSSKENSLYTPEIFGGVRVKYEQTLVNGEHRFNVRNSRLGVKGFASEHMKYAIQIDFNNEGKVSILDSYVAYTLGDFEFSLGQQQYHFNQDLDRGPTSSLFSNRSFLAKYLTTYYLTGADGESVRTIGSRDIGAMVSYKSRTELPVHVVAGLFNGTGANNPEWGNSVNFNGRVALGGDKGLQGAISSYLGYTPFGQKINMYGTELRYAQDNYLIEAAYAQRQLEEDGLHYLHAAHIHGYYRFDLRKNKLANYIAPHLRADTGRGIEFINQSTHCVDRYSADRLTFALNIGLSSKWLKSELRLAYEEYLVSNKPSDFFQNPLLQDKFTIELIAAF